MADIAPRDSKLDDGDDVVDLDGPAAPAAGSALRARGAEGPDGVVDLDAAAADEGLPAGAVEAADGTVTLTLARPVTIRFRRGGNIREESFERLVFHRLNGTDMRVLAGAPLDKMAAVGIARSVRMDQGRVDAIYDRMDAADANAASQVVAYFLGAGRKTGR